ncbi:SGNH/GDSL hydrolase family protein [Teichococcus oryzae]|uniref:SGNH/GDSL hydrolase family protein n=1 Tax=Teichococcus oryzae TaxID=1608942 RepID=A0A5B2TE54_9PROT|nr:SGNH/GDSL hydrolase family protein [Pseudoroseomonas oryzae]KAA2212782.1 SGNH/GDSL hydrolase family protein [Pseudoroseomonas oryzae]
MRRPAALAILALIVAFPALAQEEAPPPATDNVPAACTVPDDLRELHGSLPRMADLLRRRQPVRILAVGSSSTAGTGASNPARAYPPRLETALERLLPGAEVTVRNEGVGGEVASTTLARMERLMAEWSPDVVLWQLGTNDALRGVTAQAFAGILREGADAARGRDLLLINPQFYPRIPDQGVYLSFVEAIRQVAEERHLPLMRRYDIMRFWDGLPRPAIMLSEDGFHMNDLGYQCMAEVLAGGMVRQVSRINSARR